MAEWDDWDEIAERIREDADPHCSPWLPRLYELALADGPAFLQTFRARLGEDRLQDLIHDLLVERLPAIVAADAPRAYYCTALRRKAISWLRRGDAAVAGAPSESGGGVASSDAFEEARHAFMVDASAALARLSERDRGIVVAVALGNDREEIARDFGTTRANVDQIVSRLRKRFEGGEP